MKVVVGLRFVVVLEAWILCAPAAPAFVPEGIDVEHAMLPTLSAMVEQRVTFFGDDKPVA